jgi:hypothetical protein
MKPTTQSFKKFRIMDYIKGVATGLIMALLAVTVIDLPRLIDCFTVFYK